jgi:threonine dehydrogenase-like Zn-dependent dehydrogenase
VRESEGREKKTDASVGPFFARPHYSGKEHTLKRIFRTRFSIGSRLVHRSRRLSCAAGLLLLASAWPAAADPVFLNSTYLGGSLDDLGRAVATQGDITFVAGATFSLDYPVVAVSSGKPEDEQTPDVFVTALGASGTPLYSTYVAMGNESESVLGIGVGPDGSAYVAALAYHGADTSAVVAKLEPDGELAWTREEAGGYFAQGMTVDAQGNVYVTGRDTSNGGDEAFVWKLDPEGTTVYWTGIDGDGYEYGRDVAVDAAGNAYVAGLTVSTDLDGADEKAPDGENAFVTRLDPAGSIVWSTYLGGSAEDWGERIAVAANGDLLVTGTTKSSNFPTVKALQDAIRGPKDLFLTRLTPDGKQVYSTYLGGSFDEEVADLALEGSSLYLVVISPWADSPLRQPLDPSCGVNFVVQLDAGTAQPLYAACLPGSSVIYSVAPGSAGVALTGAAGSGLPLVEPWQPASGGGEDAFAAKLVLTTRKPALQPR